jgi:methylmalonyl-CoA mutase
MGRKRVHAHRWPRATSAARSARPLPDVIAACKVAGFDLIVVETSGIGQGDAAIVPLVDAPLYVMTPEFGAASQLEKIDMLDFAEFVAINKFDRKGAADALRDVRQAGASATARPWHAATEDMPVFGTMASRFNDDGVTALYQALLPTPGRTRAARCSRGRLPRAATRHRARNQVPIVPPQRARYLAEIADTRARLQAPRARAGARWRARCSSCAQRAAHAAPWTSPTSRARPRPR